MKKIDLFYATNRNHEGRDRWNPKSYGPKFSSNGHYNLRFGEISIEYDENKVQKYLDKKFKGDRVGDGEGLSSYLTGQAKKSNVEAYKDDTPDVDAPLALTKNPSTKMFRAVKEYMMDSTDVVVFIHGFNVDWYEAVGSALSLEFMLNRNKIDGEDSIKVILFTWPSNGKMMKNAAYKSDRHDARDSAQAIARGFLKLRDFLLTLRLDARQKNDRLCNQEMHLVCHSMGNFVLQNAVQAMIEFSDGQKLSRLFKHIFLCAPDIDDNVLEPDEAMGRLHELARYVSIYYNEDDIAMYLSDYTKGNAERLGHSGNARLAEVHNKIHQIDCSETVKGFVEHNYFLWATVNDDIRKSILGVSFRDESRNRKQLGSSREWEIV